VNLGGRKLAQLDEVSVADKVGLEATLTNSTLQGHERVMPPELDEALNQLVKEVELMCRECEIQRYMGPSFEEEFRVVFPDGFRFNLTRDHRVIEITGDPIAQADLKVHTQKLTEVLLPAGQRIGLRPAKHTGGGHLHFDFQAFFKNDPRLLRDFLVDAFNHQEIYRVFFGGQVDNAPTLWQLPDSSRQAFLQLIEDFDRGPFSIFELIQRLESEVYHQTANARYSPPQKYQAISFIHALSGHQTVEFRHVRPYQNGEQVRLISEALLARRDFLRGQREQGVVPSPEVSQVAEVLEDLNKEWFRAREFLEESHLNLSRYLALFPEETLEKSLTLISDEKLLNFFKSYTLWTPFDAPERVLALLSQKRFQNLPLKDQENILLNLFDKFEELSEKAKTPLKTQLERYCIKQKISFSSLKERWLEIKNARVSCGRLMESLL
jgi:hypothetical protein